MELDDGGCLCASVSYLWIVFIARQAVYIHLGTVNSALSANYISYDHGARGRSSGWDRLSGAA
jgi:hypothetical protein